MGYQQSGNKLSKLRLHSNPQLYTREFNVLLFTPPSHLQKIVTIAISVNFEERGRTVFVTHFEEHLLLK